MTRRRRFGRGLAALAVVAGLGACSTPIPPAAGSNPADPYESFNRRVTAFNDRFDHAVATPAAKAYNAALPRVVRNCVSNIFENLQEVANAVNAVLQARPGEVGRDTGRLIINTTVGFGGCFDVARQVGI
jgi:phospholipid-binding lipoprotein MlaA